MKNVRFLRDLQVFGKKFSIKIHYSGASSVIGKCCQESVLLFRHGLAARMISLRMHFFVALFTPCASNISVFGLDLKLMTVLIKWLEGRFWAQEVGLHMGRL